MNIKELISTLRSVLAEKGEAEVSMETLTNAHADTAILRSMNVSVVVKYMAHRLNACGLLHPHGLTFRAARPIYDTFSLIERVRLELWGGRELCSVPTELIHGVHFNDLEMSSWPLSKYLLHIAEETNTVPCDLGYAIAFTPVTRPL